MYTMLKHIHRQIHEGVLISP